MISKGPHNPHKVTKLQNVSRCQLKGRRDNNNSNDRQSQSYSFWVQVLHFIFLTWFTFLQKQRNKSKIPQLKYTILPLQTIENKKPGLLLISFCTDLSFSKQKMSVAKYELSSLQHPKILPINAAILRGKSIDFYFVIFWNKNMN